MGRNADAAGRLQQALALDPTSAEARRGLAELALERGAIDEAASLLEANLAADPTDVPALVKLGVARMRAGRVAEALALFERAVALEPGNPEALLDLAGALGRSGRSQAAIPYFEKAIASGGRSTTALNGLAVARLESGDARAPLARSGSRSRSTRASPGSRVSCVRSPEGRSEPLSPRKAPADGAAPTPPRPRRGLLLGLAAIALVASAAALVWRQRPAPRAKRPALNVLLVTLDTTRADRLGSYGHAAARTRYLDRLAAEGARFETAIAPAPITLPSHSSIFTGLYPVRARRAQQRQLLPGRPLRDARDTRSRRAAIAPGPS